MRYLLCACVISCFTLLALAGQRQDDMKELDAKIARNLASDSWNGASREFVRIVWEDYKKAHINPPKNGWIGLGRRPDAESLDMYIGAFRSKPEGEVPVALEISKSESGRFFVEVEGHRIPAVIVNHCIAFTTGDVVYSAVPQLANKPYCTLEMFVVILTEDKFFLASPLSPPETWRPLSKLEEKQQ